MSAPSDPYVETLRKFYNEVAQKYAAGPMSSWHREAAETLIQAAGPHLREGSTVLDLATGSGNVALAAAGKVGATGRIIGVDISDELLSYAKRNASELGVDSFVEFINQDVTHLSLPEGQKFDVVFCGSAVGLFPDAPALLRHVAENLLKEDGIFIADTHTNTPAVVVVNLAEARGIKCKMDALWWNDPSEALRQLFQGAGYKVDCFTMSNEKIAKFDASTPEAIEKLWENMVAKAPWLGWGDIASSDVEDLKREWVKSIGEHEKTDGHLVDKMPQYIAVATPKKG